MLTHGLIDTRVFVKVETCSLWLLRERRKAPRRSNQYFVLYITTMSDTESEPDIVPGIGTTEFLAATSDLAYASDTSFEYSSTAVREAVETLKGLDISTICHVRCPFMTFVLLT